MTTPSPAQSLTADVVVVGAGAGGLSTAVTAAYHGLRVVVLERADACGGATAWSGGWMWAPGNPLAQADGVDEDVETVPHLPARRSGRPLRRPARRRVPGGRAATWWGSSTSRRR